MEIVLSIKSEKLVNWDGTQIGFESTIKRSYKFYPDNDNLR